MTEQYLRDMAQTGWMKTIAVSPDDTEYPVLY